MTPDIAATALLERVTRHRDSTRSGASAALDPWCRWQQRPLSAFGATLMLVGGCTEPTMSSLDASLDDAVVSLDVTDPDPDSDPDAGQSPPPRVTGITLDSSLLEMPGFGQMPNSVLAPVALGQAYWLGHGFVVTAAACHQYRETRGFWVFGEDGAPRGEAHTCLDSLAEGEDPDNLHLWAHQWSSGNTVFARLDADRILLGGQAGTSRPYPPKIYDVSAERPRLVTRAYGLRVDPTATSSPPNDFAADDAPHFSHAVVVGDRVVARVANVAGPGEIRVLSVPDLHEVDRVTSNIEPLATISGLVLGRTQDGSSSALYTLGADGTLTPRVPLPDAVASGTTVVADPLDPSHIVVAVAGGVRQLRVRDTGVEDLGLTPLGALDAFAVFGRALVVGRCDETVPLPSRCGVEVLGVDGRAELPDERVWGDPEARSPSGRVLSLAVAQSGVVVAVTPYGAYRLVLQLE
ncbi:MAG: hypothetical protein K1X94_15660 [Sandaracinaceae bacterium]|nr:hypothetical protein [Sandaracinaceae bacterium]